MAQVTIQIPKTITIAPTSTTTPPAIRERGIHYYNYCDLPLWDIAFGTFRNPQTFTGKCGYYDGASSRIGEMRIGRDVTRPPRVQGPPAEFASPVRGGGGRKGRRDVRCDRRARTWRVDATLQNPLTGRSLKTHIGPIPLY